MKKLVLIVSLLLLATGIYANSDGSLADSLAKKAVSMIILQDQRNQLNEKNGKSIENNYVIRIDTEKWIEERGGLEKILDGDNLKKMSDKLITFNKRPDSIRCYVIIINDYYIKFTAKIDQDILGEKFSWDKMVNQKDVVADIKLKTLGFIVEVNNGLEAAGFKDRIIYFYSKLVVEPYREKDSDLKTSLAYKYDRLNFIGPNIQKYEMAIRSHIKIPSQDAVSNIDNAVSSIINSTEAVIDKGYKVDPKDLVDLKDSVDHSLPNNDFSKIDSKEFKNFAALVDNAFNKKEASWSSSKGEDDYRHFNNPEILKRNVRDGNRDFDIEVLEDKLHNLEDKTGIKFFVIAGLFKYNLDKDQSNQFANEVLKYTSKLKSEEKFILITLPFYNKSVLNNASLASDPYLDVSVVSPGIYSQGVDLDLTMVTNTVEQDSYAYVMNAYKFLAKPYACHIYCIPINDRIAYLKAESESSVKGMEAMEELTIIRDRNIDELKKFDVKDQPKIDDYLVVNTVPPGGLSYTSYDTSQYKNDLAKYYEYFNFYISHLDKPDWEFVSDARRLKEPFLSDHKTFVTQFFETSSPFYSRIKSNWGMSSLDGKTYDFKVVGNYVKPVLDNLWFIPIVPNVTGWIWAESEGDYVIADGYAQGTIMELAVTVMPVGEGVGLVFSKIASTGVVRVISGKLIDVVGLKQVSRELTEQTLEKVSTLGLTEAEKTESKLILQQEAVAAFVSTSQSKAAFQALSKKETFNLYLRYVAQITGISDIKSTVKLFAHITAVGIDGFYNLTSTRLLPLLARDKAYDFTSTLVQSPVYAVHCLAYCLKAGKDFLSFEKFDSWAVLLKLDPNLSIDKKKQIYDEIINDIVVPLRTKGIDDNAIVDLLERFPYPKQLNTMLEKAGSAENLHLLLDNLLPLASNKSQVYNVISRLSKENVSNFIDDISKNSLLIKKFVERPELVDVWKILKEVNVDDAIRIGSNGELEFVRKYMDDFPNHDIGKEIADAGGYRKWADDLSREIGNIWDDIVLRGQKGVIETLSKEYKTVDDFLASAEYSQKVRLDFVKYQAKGNLADFASYSAKHKLITENRMTGRIAEDVFKIFEEGIKPQKKIQTSDGARYIDNLLNGTAREIKSGRITLNGSDFRRQIKKDIEIIKQQLSADVYKIEWHALDGIDDNALQFTRTEMTNQGVSPDLFKIVIY